MSFFEPENIRSVLKGRWAASVSVPDESCIAISTDTRTVASGDCFFALRGESHDAHDFADQAAAAGARMIIADAPDHPKVQRAARSTPICLVPDTTDALLTLSAAYRDTLKNTLVIAVTGSNGKTTTVRLIQAALAAKGSVCASEKSFNNHIGLPLTLLRAKPTDNFLVCEVGTSNPGEIALLAEALRPDIAVLTSLGRAHAGRFDSFDAYAREKADLFRFLAPSGLAIAHAPAAEQIADVLATVPRVITFANQPGADIQLTACAQQWIDGAPASTATVDTQTEFTLPIAGEHNALNALAAFAVAREAGMTDEQTAATLANVKHAPMRLEHSEAAGITIFCDAYNANPESMRASIVTFAALTKDHARRIVIVGDMLELGDAAPQMHTEVGSCIAANLSPDLLVAIGEHAPRIAHPVEKAHPAAHQIILSELTEAHAASIAARIKPGDAVLIKASRSLALERIAEAIHSRASIPAP